MTGKRAYTCDSLVLEVDRVAPSLVRILCVRRCADGIDEIYEWIAPSHGADVESDCQVMRREEGKAKNAQCVLVRHGLIDSLLGVCTSSPV